MPTFLDRENWMSHLDKSVRLVDSHIPASHDSSCYPTIDFFQMFKNEWVGAVTQIAGYTAQLNAGIRYFDMRITWNDGDLYMKHSNYYYQKFSDVLDQIRSFSDSHPGEYIFMDLDFNDQEPNIVSAILDRLESHLDKSKFATAHVNGGVFNPNVTWQDLGDTRFLITWSHDNWEGRTWATNSKYFRDSPYGDFDKHSPQWIAQYLTNQLNGWNGQGQPPGPPELPPLDNGLWDHWWAPVQPWDKQKLMISQVINTPFLSFLTKPGELDANAQGLLNWWIRSQFTNFNFQTYQPNPPGMQNVKPNIVMRDFVNAQYNRAILDLVIQQNAFSSPPTYSTSDNLIYQMDVVRYRMDGTSLYLTVGPDRELTLTDTPDASCEFLLRDHDYNRRDALPYSNNLSGDDDRDVGNFRPILRNDPSVGSEHDICVSVRPENQSLFYGIGWHPAQDRETFKHFNPDELGNKGQPLYSGSRVLIRSMIGSADNDFQKLVNVVEHTAVAMIPFVGNAFNNAWNDSSGLRPFLMVAHDSQDFRHRVLAGSPGPDYATTFIIEKVN